MTCRVGRDFEDGGNLIDFQNGLNDFNLYLSSRDQGDETMELTDFNLHCEVRKPERDVAHWSCEGRDCNDAKLKPFLV
ncbi:hypothetical protein PAAG_12182 [Paracoccidioides lutzii Pb01]|uniref:Uncharacterized protein n=1 Tax=Paracoccidioides lutzii (strain ATCC MYA-826 / Pb01) TaxID=502779 RepID=A0A0A2VJV5_PARBA|nr:hypothetical protein PAAG_12182 [Paracoccidioides lutzii Pb01]KGQ01144.1 hypothetical protein PAAG_12182 [Paracoccidioides lutzii Pb01]